MLAMYSLRQRIPSRRDLGVLLVHLVMCGELVGLYQGLVGMTHHLLVVVHHCWMMHHLWVEDLANLQDVDV